MPKTVNFQLVTRLVRVSEGLYRTYPSQVFQGKAYEEGEIVEFQPPAVSGYAAPGAVVVPVTASWEVFQALDNAQSGGDVEGEAPNWEIVDGSAFDADTGEQVNAAEV